MIVAFPDHTHLLFPMVGDVELYGIPTDTIRFKLSFLLLFSVLMSAQCGPASDILSAYKTHILCTQVGFEKLS